jgi:hypothetical protein
MHELKTQNDSKWFDKDHWQTKNTGNIIYSNKYFFKCIPWQKYYVYEAATCIIIVHKQATITIIKFLSMWFISMAWSMSCLQYFPTKW